MTEVLEPAPPSATTSEVQAYEPLERGVLGRLRASGLMMILVNAGSLIGTTLATGGLGSVYWWLAARSFAPADLGSASAAVAAATLLASLSILGTGTLIIGELPRRASVDRVRLIMTALVVSCVVGAGLGAIFSVAAPHVAGDLGVFGEGLSAVGFFGLSVSAMAAALVVDNALIGLLRGHLQFGRNVVAAIAKLVILYAATRVPSVNGAIAIYASFGLGTLVSFVAVVRPASIGHMPRSAYAPQWSLLRHLGRAALEHHTLNLSLQVPVLIMPLLVTALLSATANAYFYVAMMFATFVSLVPTALCTVLYAVGSHDPSTFAAKMRLTLSLSLAAIVIANLGLIVLGPPVLGLFGDSYAREVLPVLRLLFLGMFPGIVKTHFVAVSQTHRRIRRAAVINVSAAVAELAAAAVGAHLAGLSGFVVGYDLVLCLEALIMAPSVIQALLNSGPKRTSRFANAS